MGTSAMIEREKKLKEEKEKADSVSAAATSLKNTSTTTMDTSSSTQIDATMTTTINNNGIKDKKTNISSLASLSAEDKKIVGVIHVLSAIVVTFPYEVPVFLPPILSLLSKLLAYIPTWMQNIIKQAVAEFKKSHEDEWKSKYIYSFTEQELENLLDT